MSIDAAGILEQLKCEVCGARVATLRRGRCWGCYQKWQQAQPVGLGAQCVICGERRKDNLQPVELFGRWLNMCHICAVRPHPLNPVPPSIEGIRKRLQRDRRYGDRRRGQADIRLRKKERRVGQRRAVLLEEDDILWMEDAPIIEIESRTDDQDAETTSLFDRVDEASLGI